MADSGCRGKSGLWRGWPVSGARFVAQGTAIPDVRVNELWLDVGNALDVGVIDHHHLDAFRGSTASLIHEHPELVAEAVDEAGGIEETTVVMHTDPDLDCVAATYLSLSYAREGGFPAHTDALCHYVDMVDSGWLGMSTANPYSLYSAYQMTAHRLGLRNWPDASDRWCELVVQGLGIIDFVMDALAKTGRPLTELDAFDCPGQFGSDDRRAVEEDLARYRRKLEDPETAARTETLRLPSQFGGRSDASFLLVRNVQGTGDPERVMFFKDWARTDQELAPETDGFIGTCVYQEKTQENPRRAIVSVRPDSGLSLRGLGGLLDQKETEARKAIHGQDDRVIDPETGEKRTPRPGGYPNADPWYDGRGNGYTIVDAPRSGTILTAQDIERTALDFGDATQASGADELEASGDMSKSDLGFLAQLSGERSDAEPVPESPFVFVSYPRKQSGWVKEHVYVPLVQTYGQASVFFDESGISGGKSWLSSIANGVANCSAFVAVYCPDYFSSEFCEFELQLAITRDPVGRRGIVLPVLLGDVDLPRYCHLIQTACRPGEDVQGALRSALDDVLVS